MFRASDTKLTLLLGKIPYFDRFRLDSEFIYQWDILNTTLKMTVSMDSYIERKLFFNKNYGKNIIETILSYNSPWKKTNGKQKAFIDVGANIGSICLPIAVAKKDWIIIAYEPNPAIYDRLVKNIEINDISNVITSNKGLSSEKGQLSLNVPSSSKANFGSSSYLENSDISKLKKVNTIVTTLDEELSTQYEVSAIKIDTQGFELEVLKGAQDIIKKHRPFIIFELEDIYQETPLAYRVLVKNYFEELNYELYELDHYNHKILRYYDLQRPSINANIVAIPKCGCGSKYQNEG